MRLFHFSDQGGIERFTPRTVSVPSPRAAGREWLNGPLVWAIDDWHQPMYLFPRDCPRILIWPVADTTAPDKHVWWGKCQARMVAHVELGWLEAIKQARLFRYELPSAGFECLEDAGMWVSRAEVEPIALDVIDDLPRALSECNVELRARVDLTPLREAWSSSLHVSGIRLRHATRWVCGE